MFFTRKAVQALVDKAFNTHISGTNALNADWARQCYNDVTRLHTAWSHERDRIDTLERDLKIILESQNAMIVDIPAKRVLVYKNGPERGEGLMDDLEDHNGVLQRGN